MGRLTFDGNFCDIAMCRELPCQHDNNCTQKQVWERLKQYEDTGLTPELLNDPFTWVTAMNLAAKPALGVEPGRLRELAEADKAGRVVVVPCKAGDTLYEVTSRKTISEYRVKAIRVELFCVFIEWDIAKGFVDKSPWGVSADEIGRTVFLTREEADVALKGAKNGRG